MDLYTEMLKTCLTENALARGGENSLSVLEIIFLSYRERKSGDTGEISKAFDQLDHVLSKLTLREYDQVWDLTCKLCDGHEREAFFAGFRTAAQMAAELWKNQR